MIHIHIRKILTRIGVGLLFIVLALGSVWGFILLLGTLPSGCDTNACTIFSWNIWTILGLLPLFTVAAGAILAVALAIGSWVLND